MTRASRTLLTLALIATQVVHACYAAPGLVPQEGFVQVPGGPVWYRVFGSGTATPLIIVHGGPGRQSCYLDPLAERMSVHRPVVLYDQLGTGRSGRPTDPSLWTVERSVRELAALREALGLRKVHLMGHSWGGAVVGAYVTRDKPSGVESVVLAAPLLSTRMWIADANVLRAQLPIETQEILRRNEQKGTVHSEEYAKATQVFYGRFAYHHKEVKRPDSCAQAPSNQEMYEFMWGPTEFNATGNLLNFDVTPGLSKLTMPAMIVVGRYDEVRVETAEKFRAAIPGSIVEVIEDASHLAPLENVDTYASVLENFLSAVDKSGTSDASIVENPVSVVRAQRAESNAAIKAHDATRLRNLFADDYHGIQGTSGDLDSGGEATARSYGGEEFKDPTFVSYERTPTSIVAAQSGKRVAESGNWEGIWRKPDGTMRKTGIYLAMWIPSGGTWRLKSESFVTLSCTGSASCDKAA